MITSSPQDVVQGRQAEAPTAHNGSKIIFVDRILDNVHGYIELTKVEREIIELPIFKRLQSIKQLSLVNWVFPGAEHTRYTHSLGVMYIVDKMAVQLEFSDEDRQLIRLAGLLHDIGHYPLSHVGESAYKVPTEDYCFVQGHIKDTCSTIEKITKEPKPIFDDPNGSKQHHHEIVGERVIRASNEIKGLIERHCPFVNIEYICDIIVGRYKLCEEYPKLAVMVQLMHSELDADRMDYLLRDASFSGTSYGAVDMGIIIKNLTIAEYDGYEIVGIKPKGITAADQFLLNRFFSISQIICNRHVAALEFMAEAIIRHAAESGSSEFPLLNRLCKQWVKKYEVMDNYLQFTDHLFWNVVYTYAKQGAEATNPEYIVTFARFLTKHKEIGTVPLSEVVCSGFDSSCLLDQVKQSQAYANLCENENSNYDMFMRDSIASKGEDDFIIQRVHIVRVTDKTPITKFEDYLRAFDNGAENDAKEERRRKYRRYRMLDGLAVIDSANGTKKVHLLVDDSRSLLKSMYNLQLVIMREYNVHKAEDEVANAS